MEIVYNLHNGNESILIGYLKGYPIVLEKGPSKYRCIFMATKNHKIELQHKMLQFFIRYLKEQIFPYEFALNESFFVLKYEKRLEYLNSSQIFYEWNRDATIKELPSKFKNLEKPKAYFYRK